MCIRCVGNIQTFKFTMYIITGHERYTWIQTVEIPKLSSPIEQLTVYYDHLQLNLGSVLLGVILIGMIVSTSTYIGRRLLMIYLTCIISASLMAGLVTWNDL